MKQTDFRLRFKDDPVLHQESWIVHETEDISDLLTAMWGVMDRKHYPQPAGLAANQVGALKRVITINVNGMRQAFVNPNIVKYYGGGRTSQEGCLSFPGVLVKVPRWGMIILEARTETGEFIRRKLQGLNAFVVQHEIDHLDGKTIA